MTTVGCTVTASRKTSVGLSGERSERGRPCRCSSHHTGRQTCCRIPAAAHLLLGPPPPHHGHNSFSRVTVSIGADPIGVGRQRSCSQNLLRFRDDALAIGADERDQPGGKSLWPLRRL